jgi:NAD(P)-dependent dehydrogenase (short-subunit alcohol dehydrogenase family)
VLPQHVVPPTGAGRGLGRAHALLLAEEGAAVVVNDPGVGGDGSCGDASPAEQVVAEIESRGGRAVANLDSCADWTAAEKMVTRCLLGVRVSHQPVALRRGGDFADKSHLSVQDYIDRSRLQNAA